ncbi:hypothetical protein GGH95_004357 [Coemansia sp. RSA 1836]|nr:hypothetical protein GGH95_004357 [Coemansia sp. RSA 1836]
MTTYSPVAIAGVCAGIFGVAGIILAILVAVRRRSRLANTLRNDLEEGEDEIVACAAAAPALVVANETQPLLSESAIRTRYASNPNEFARSYIDRPQHSSYMDPRSLGESPSALPYSPAENVVIVAPSDMSDSEDSGIESCVSAHSDEPDAIQLEPTNDDAVAAPEEFQPTDLVSDAQPSPEPLTSLMIPRGIAGYNAASATLVPTPVHTSFVSSQPADCADEGNTSSIEKACLAGPSETEANPAPRQHVFSKPLASTDRPLLPQAPAAGSEGRPRSSTLSARARVFVPGSRSRTMVDTTSGSVGELKDCPAPASNASSSALSDAQMQALGHSAQSSNAADSSSSTHSSLSESKTDVDAEKTDSERQSAPAGADTSEPTGSAGAEPSTAFTPNRRCRFWPSCNNKNCKYSHPSRTCMAYPNCTYGAHCMFIHPCDAQRINDVISRGNVKRNKRKKNRDLVRLNNIGDFAE